jgi:hypothetical protein
VSSERGCESYCASKHDDGPSDCAHDLAPEIENAGPHYTSAWKTTPGSAGFGDKMPAAMSFEKCQVMNG